MSSVVIAGNTSGSVTLAAPDVAGTTTLTLPATSGTVLAPSGGTLGIAQGGTGATTLTANNVLLGNGTSAVQAVAPSTSGNVLTSNGTTWTSAAPPSSTPTTAQVQTAMAGSAAGDIGTYAFLGQTSLTTSTYTVGSNYSGLGFGAARSTTLANGSLVNQSALSAASGTWKCMGNDGNVGSATRLTVFLRIA